MCARGAREVIHLNWIESRRCPSVCQNNLLLEIKRKMRSFVFFLLFVPFSSINIKSLAI